MKHSIDYPLASRPIMGFADDYPAGMLDPPHSHPRSQLTYCTAGVMLVMVSDAVFMLPPRRAIWIPAGVEHEVRCRGAVSSHTLYIDPALDQAPLATRVIEVSDLVRALIVEVGGFEPDYNLDGREGEIARLLLSEVRRMPATPTDVPMPQDERLLRVCHALINDPTDGRDLDDWASFAAMGRRTFTRAFRRETGAGLATWRQRMRLVAAIPKLEAGQSVTTVAYDVGYESASAFTATFHRIFGFAPSTFIARPREESTD
jgi:AraC-like DNA-binding protein